MSARVLENRVCRVVQLLLQLASGIECDSVKLSENLGVSRRTIFRDIGLLRRAGVPIVFNEETHGYELSDDQLGSAINRLELQEYMWLFAALRLSHLRSIPQAAAFLDSLGAKLLCTLPSQDRVNLARLFCAQRLQLAPATTCTPREEVVNTILGAIVRRTQVRLVVQGDDDGTYITVLSPYQIVVAPDHWLIVGRSSRHRNIEQFDIRKIVQADPTEDFYLIPHDAGERSTKVAQ